MKRYQFKIGLLCLALMLVSWGVTGHRVIARIAQNHLNKNVSLSLIKILDGAYLENISNDADDLLLTDKFSNTLSWHYLGAPPGLDSQQFESYVMKAPSGNIYQALSIKIDRLKYLLNSKDKDLPAARSEEADCVKWIVNLVADAHQPTHIGQLDTGREQKTIRFRSIATNLNSLWENRLIDADNASFPEFTKKADTASTEVIQKWQSDKIITWLYESYKLNKELTNALHRDTVLGENYLKAYQPVISKRLDEAGIRLAGLMNNIFTNITAGGEGVISLGADQVMMHPQQPKTIKINEVDTYVGKQAVVVCSKISGHRESGNMTFVYLGAPYPDQRLTVVLKDKAKDMADNGDNKEVCVTGNIISYSGKPTMIITQPQKIK